MPVLEDFLENMYEVICNLSTGVEPHEARQAMIELLEDFQFSSLESAQDVRALDIALVTDHCLGPILCDMTLFCSRPLVIMRAIARLELRERR